MQNQHYVYAIIGGLILIAIGIFIWAQPANAPTDGEMDSQQGTTTEQVSEQDTQEEASTTTQTAQNNESNLNFLGGSAETAQETDTDTSTGSTQQQQNTGATQTQDTDTETTNTETAENEPQQQNDPTAGWRTYTNADFGIRFKLPLGWTLNENSQAGEYTMQIYSGEEDDKTAEFNLLFYPAELNRADEGNFNKSVNGYEAYVDTNDCPSDTRCMLKQVIFPLEEGEIVGNNWSGDVLEVSAITHQIATTQLETTFDNILSTLVITTN